MYMDSFFWGGGFEIMFTLVFVLIIGIFVVTAVKGLSQWNKNNHCPRLSVTASVVSKRTNVSRHRSPWFPFHYIHQLLRDVPGGER